MLTDTDGPDFTEPVRLFFGNGMAVLDPGSYVYVNYHYIRDHLGSVRVVTNDTGAVVARFDYDPYGQAHQRWHSGELDPLTYQPIQFDFLFTGHLHHGRSGLYFAPYRAYDPELGRWISRDPIDTDGGFNLYEYVGGDPVNWVDPWGFERNPNLKGKKHCDALLAKIERQLSALERMESKFDPEEDAIGGHPYDHGPDHRGVTQPYGHAKRILDLRKALRENLERYNRECLTGDDDDHPDGHQPMPYEDWVDARNHMSPNGDPFVPQPSVMCTPAPSGSSGSGSFLPIPQAPKPQAAGPVPGVLGGVVTAIGCFFAVLGASLVFG